MVGIATYLAVFNIMNGTNERIIMKKILLVSMVLVLQAPVYAAPDSNPQGSDSALAWVWGLHTRLFPQQENNLQTSVRGGATKESQAMREKWLSYKPKLEALAQEVAKVESFVNSSSIHQGQETPTWFTEWVKDLYNRIRNFRSGYDNDILKPCGVFLFFTAVDGAAEFVKGYDPSTATHAENLNYPLFKADELMLTLERVCHIEN